MAPTGRLAPSRFAASSRAGRAPSARRALGLLLLGWLVATSACQRKHDPLPRLGVVGAFSLTDQAGKAVTADSLRHQVWVAAFFFTRCPTICPRITRRMRALQLLTANVQPPPVLESFSVDPENDTPPVLLAYAKRFDADLRTWSFLTGDTETMKRTVVDGFKLALDGKPDPTAENGGIIHGSHLALVDRELVIRGYYRTDDDEEMSRLAEDAARLTKD